MHHLQLPDAGVHARTAVELQEVIGSNGEACIRGGVGKADEVAGDLSGFQASARTEVRAMALRRDGVISFLSQPTSVLLPCARR